MLHFKVACASIFGSQLQIFTLNWTLHGLSFSDVAKLCVPSTVNKKSDPAMNILSITRSLICLIWGLVKNAPFGVACASIFGSQLKIFMPNWTLHG